MKDYLIGLNSRTSIEKLCRTIGRDRKLNPWFKETK